MLKLNRTNERIACDKLRIALLERGLTPKDLAAGIGMPFRSFSTTLSAGMTSDPVRRKIEAYFGYELLIWSDYESLALRRACRERFNFDPELLSGPLLKAKARELGISTPKGVKNSFLVSEILSRVAIKSNPRK